MGIKTGGNVKVWEVKKADKYTDLRVSTYKKVGEEFQTDYSGYIRLVGEANKLNLREKDKIKINSFEVTNNYNKDKNVTYTNIIVYDAELNN